MNKPLTVSPGSTEQFPYMAVLIDHDGRCYFPMHFSCEEDARRFFATYDSQEKDSYVIVGRRYKRSEVEIRKF